MINSRSLDELDPIVKEKAEAFLEKCKESGIKVIITSTYRDHEYQNDLYAQGRSKPGRRVTSAKGGQSFHNWRVAFDFVPVINGSASWNNEALFIQCGEIAESLGLEWGGRWKKFQDSPHCQYTGGLTLADFQNGKTLGSNHA